MAATASDAVTQNSTDNNAPYELVITAPANLADNDYVIIATADSGDDGTITSTGFTALIDESQTFSRIALLYKKITNAAGEPADYTVTYSGAIRAGAVAFRISGADGTTLVDVTGARATGTSTAPDATDITTSVDDELVLWVGWADEQSGGAASTDWTMPTSPSFTELGEAGGQGGGGNARGSVAVGYFVQATAGTVSPNAGALVDSGDWAACMVAINTAGGATQNITPTATTVTVTSGTLTITTGAVNISPAAETVDVTAGTVSLAIDVTLAEATVTVTPGTLTAAPGAVNITPTATTVTVTAGSVTVQVAAAAQDITPNPVVVAVEPGVPPPVTIIVTPGAAALSIDITPTATTVTVTASVLTLKTESQITPDPPTITATGTVAVTPGAVDVTPDPTVVTVTSGTLVVTLAAATQDITPDPTTVTATAGTVALSVDVPFVAATVTVTPGTATLDLHVTPAATTVTVTDGTLTVTLGGAPQNVTPAAVTVTATAGTAVITTGAVDITPDPTVVTVTPGVVIVAIGAITPNPITVIVSAGSTVVTVAGTQAITPTPLRVAVLVDSYQDEYADTYSGGLIVGATQFVACDPPTVTATPGTTVVSAATIQTITPDPVIVDIVPGIPPPLAVSVVPGILTMTGGGFPNWVYFESRPTVGTGSIGLEHERVGG